MELKQNDLEDLKERMRSGELTAAQANVEMVRMRRVMLVTTSMTRDLRSALNAAVKTGQLLHIKKYGHKPEAYFHPSFKHLVAGERNEHARSIYRAVASVCV